jgi:hypothetical protein
MCIVSQFRVSRLRTGTLSSGAQISMSAHGCGKDVPQPTRLHDAFLCAQWLEQQVGLEALSFGLGVGFDIDRWRMVAREARSLRGSERLSPVLMTHLDLDLLASYLGKRRPSSRGARNPLDTLPAHARRFFLHPAHLLRPCCQERRRGGLSSSVRCPQSADTPFPPAQRYGCGRLC